MGVLSGLFKNVASSAKGAFHKKPAVPKPAAPHPYTGEGTSQGFSIPSWGHAHEAQTAPSLRLLHLDHPRAKTAEEDARDFAEHQRKVQRQMQEASEHMSRVNERVHSHPHSDLKYATHSGIYTTSGRKMIAGLIDVQKNFGKQMSPVHPTTVQQAKGLLAADKKGSEKLFSGAAEVAKAVPFKAEGNVQRRNDIAKGIRDFRNKHAANPGAKRMFSVGYKHGALDKVKENAKYTGGD